MWSWAEGSEDGKKPKGLGGRKGGRQWHRGYRTLNSPVSISSTSCKLREDRGVGFFIFIVDICSTQSRYLLYTFWVRVNEKQLTFTEFLREPVSVLISFLPPQIYIFIPCPDQSFWDSWA